jgi:hypothetical protein
MAVAIFGLVSSRRSMIWLLAVLLVLVLVLTLMLHSRLVAHDAPTALASWHCVTGGDVFGQMMRRNKGRKFFQRRTVGSPGIFH